MMLTTSRHTHELNLKQAGNILHDVPEAVRSYCTRIILLLPDTEGFDISGLDSGYQDKKVIITPIPSGQSPGINGQRIAWVVDGSDLLIYPNPRDISVIHTTHESGEFLAP